MTAQNNYGTIIYNYKKDYTKINEKMPWKTAADLDRDRLTRGKWRGEYKGEDYDYYFDGEKSLYERRENEENTGWSWRASKYILTKDYKERSRKDLVESMGRVWLIEDDATKYKWKILNEIQEIAGYLCMKAETVDTVKNQVIHAWFSDAIPVNGGPEGYDGLPGMILKINKDDGAAVIEATKVEIAPVDFDIPFPKKMKGKKITTESYNEKIKAYIEDRYAAKRNPYWDLRY